MKEKLYIAYGSNLDRRQMARRCPTAEVVCNGMLYGHELLFRGSQFGAVATVEPKPGACVPVLVWKIKPSDERALDLYEGYPHLYRKENLSVTMDGGERDIMAYVMPGEREYGVPARSYYETIARGYADAGFCALPGFVDSKNEEKTERNAGYLVVSHSGGGMLRQGTRKGIRRTPANRGMRAHWVVKGLDISEDVCHGMCP